MSEGHLAWFIVDAVGQMDLREFYAAYRSDGWGAAAYDPGMMAAILLYAYCACFSFRVIITSSGLGSGFFEGWLWATMTLGTASMTAGRNTSAVRTIAELTFPW